MTPRLFGRRERPPVALTSQLAGDDRIVSWADAADGAVVAASLHGLWWPSGDGYRLVGWEFVDKATWRDGILTVVEGVLDGDVLIDQPPVAVRLNVPRDLPPAIRKRVEGNIVQREEASIAGGTVRFVARRQPGRDGLVWWAHLQAGTPDTTAVRSAIAARLARLRAEPADESRR